MIEIDEFYRFRFGIDRRVITVVGFVRCLDVTDDAHVVLV